MCFSLFGAFAGPVPFRPSQSTIAAGVANRMHLRELDAADVSSRMHLPELDAQIVGAMNPTNPNAQTVASREILGDTLLRKSSSLIDSTVLGNSTLLGKAARKHTTLRPSLTNSTLNAPGNSTILNHRNSQKYILEDTVSYQIGRVSAWICTLLYLVHKSNKVVASAADILELPP
jgi:hypothetical protein